MRLRIEPFVYAVVASAAAILVGLYWGQSSLQQALYMVRGTARVGVPLVLAIYAASALYRIWPNRLTLWFNQNRRSLGLSFALTHTVHLATVLNYIAQPGSPEQPAAGIIGYVAIYLMAFSSNPHSMKTLGVWWKRVHGVGVHIIFLYYLAAYGQMLFEPELRPVGLVVVPLLMAALAIRVAAWRGARRTAIMKIDRDE